MEGILPSEIARLVLGYLEENECTEAAASFLTTSPHLQECRDVLQRGKKFSTKVNNFTLTYIMEKYWSVMGFVKDKLSRVDDCDMLKQCLHTDDLEEQIKLLIDGSSRGQRFFVNINVPQAQGGSPILSSSMRKRKHSGTQDREKCKRQFKLNVNNDLPALNTDATQLDQLPGNSEAKERVIKNLKESVFKSSKSAPGSAATEMKEKMVGGDDKKQLVPMKNSTATDTEELMHFSTAEVQTLDIESDGELEPDTPIGNLSLLTKEMLNRTEIQERIAENINKALQPVDLSSLIKETIPADNPEGNTSIMTELNNAIKTIVSKTETDPMFEQFLDEIIGTNVDDSSPNDSPSNLNSADRFNEGQNSVPADGIEDPIKRHSASSELNGATEHDTLDDLNAAAIQSIINANKITQQNNSSDSVDTRPVENSEPSLPTDVSKPSTKTDGPSTGITQLLSPPRSVTSALSIGIPNSPSVSPDSQAEAPGSILAPVSEVCGNPADVKLPATKVRRTRRQKPKPVIIQEENVVTLPTLVVCSQNELTKYISGPGPQLMPTSTSKYPSIAPRPSTETLFLRTVQVPKMNPPVVAPAPSTFQPVVKFEPSKKKFLLPKPQVTKEKEEPVTAYENNCLDEISDMPALNLDESTSHSGTGLSPFLKLNKRKRSPEPAAPPARPSPVAAALAPVPAVPETVPSVASDPLPTIDLTVDANVPLEASTHEIIKRTPKSLMKSRAKNYRLSLSTPRRRSSHVRALDFNTPTLNSSRRYSVTSARPSPSRSMNKSICRTSLFNSPVIKNLAASPKKKMASKTPSKSLNPMEVPIATRSPAPTLKGNWNKVSGVDTIIGYDSQSDSCVSPPKKIQAIEAPEAGVRKSWDSDLRQAIIIPEEDKPVKSRRNSNKSTKNDKDSAVKEPASDPVSSSVDESAGDSKQVTVEIKSSVKVTQSTVVTAKGVTKKYVKLQTLATKASMSTDSLSTSLDTSRSDKENRLVNIGSLETPRKFDDFGIPPTPRVLSPSSNPTSFIQTHADETKVGGFITTPEFPVTPCINITPKHSDNTVDSLKKDFAPYYQPGEYEKPAVKIQTDDSKSNPTAASASTSGSTSTSASTSASTESELNAMDPKLEITQFEVIKENLPKDDSSKELRISNVDLVLSRSKDSEKSLDNSRSDDSDSDSDTSSSSSSSSSSYFSDDQSKSRSRLSVSRRSGNISKKSDNLGLDLSDSIIKVDDKDEEQDGGKNLEDGGQVPVDGGQILADGGQILIDGGEIQKDNGGKIQKDDEENKEDDKQSEDKKCDDKNKEPDDVNKKIDDVREEVIEDKKLNEDKDDLEEDDDELEDGEIFEASPKKVFPLIKSDEALAAADIETPAKNDDLLDEADISETPSGSKSGAETMTTNLTSKISKLINTSSPWNQDDGKIKSLVTNLREDNPGPSYLVPKSTEDRQEILRRELDEKRLRMIDKLKPKKNNITAKPLYAGSKGKDKKEDKPKSRGKIEVRDKGQGNNYEVKDKKDDRVRSQGSHYEVKDKKDEKVRSQGNNYEKKDEKVRSQGSGSEVKDKKDEKVRSQGNNYEVKDKKDDRAKGQGTHYEVKDKKDDKVRSQGTNYEKKDEKVRSQGSSFEVKDKKDDKVRSQRVSSEVKDKKDDKVKSQKTSSEVKDKKDEKVKGHGSNSEVKDRKDEKVKDQGTKPDTKKEDKEKIPVVSAVRKSARYAARTAKSESSDDKNKRDSSKDKKKSRAEDKKDKDKEKEKEKVKINNKDKPGFKDGKELESILLNRLLLENASRNTKDGGRDDPGVISEEVKKKTSRDNKDKDKLKVEMVKRDLFSGDEMSDVNEEKKITSSQVEELMRQLHTSDPEISEPGTSGEQMEIDINVNDDNVPDKELSVLESLKLVPAAKNSGNEVEMEADVTFTHCEINFVHDDNVNSKKRYRKLTIDDISMTIPTDDGEITITLSAVPYEELFSLQPAKVKKITKKPEPPKLEPVKYKRKVQLKDSRSVVTSINSLPLATSSPNVEQPGATKLVKADVHKNDGTNKEEKANRKKNPEAKDTIDKLRDPKLLLSQLNIDKLLTTVHGPE